MIRTGIGEYGCASKGTLEDADGREHEARAYLDERHLGRTIRLQRIFFDYLQTKSRQ